VRQRLLVVVNAAAGSVDDGPVDAALTVLRSAADVEVAATASAADLDDVVAAMDGQRPVIVGGDGSLHAVIGALDRAGRLADQPVGLIPCGTGNDLARTLGLPVDPEEGARAVLSGRTRVLDVLRDDSGLLVVNAVHSGLGASAGRRAEGFKGLMGVAAYPVGAALAGVSERGWLLRVEVDGVVVRSSSGGWAADGETPLLMVAVCNGPTVGGGTALAPGAVPDDGLLDVMVSAATGAAERMAFAAALRTGEHVGREDVVVVRGRRVTVAGEPVDLDADGEVHEGRDRQAWRADAGAWSVITPSS
jgi:diacylglycerol kinase family enzyme